MNNVFFLLIIIPLPHVILMCMIVGTKWIFCDDKLVENVQSNTGIMCGGELYTHTHTHTHLICLKQKKRKSPSICHVTLGSVLCRLLMWIRLSVRMTMLLTVQQVKSPTLGMG